MNKNHSNIKVFLSFLILSLLFLISILLFSFSKQESIEKTETFIYQKENISITKGVDIEISRTPREIAVGLMGRNKLSKNSGMLFVFDSQRRLDDGFWMYQTLIPLDIAFLDKKGEILSIHQMEPCESKDFNKCPTTYPKYPYYYALEMNKNFFNKNGLSEGDIVDINFLKTK